MQCFFSNTRKNNAQAFFATVDSVTNPMVNVTFDLAGNTDHKTFSVVHFSFNGESY